MSALAPGKARSALIARLRRVEGQVRGISRMIDQDADCSAILTQVAAATRALDAAAILLLEQHLGDCVAETARVGAIDEDKIRQAAEAISGLVRS